MLQICIIWFQRRNIFCIIHSYNHRKLGRNCSKLIPVSLINFRIRAWTVNKNDVFVFSHYFSSSPSYVDTSYWHHLFPRNKGRFDQSPLTHLEEFCFFLRFIWTIVLSCFFLIYGMFWVNRFVLVSYLSSCHWTDCSWFFIWMWRLTIIDNASFPYNFLITFPIFSLFTLLPLCHLSIFFSALFPNNILCL